MKGIIYPAFLHYCPGADTPAQKIFRLSTEDKRNVTASASLCRVIYQKDSWDYIAMLPSSKITKGTWKIFLRSCVYFSKFNPVWACHCPHWWSCSGWNSLRSTLLSPHTADVCRMYNEVCCSWSALTKARIKDYCPTTTLGWSLGETRVRSLGMKETPVSGRHLGHLVSNTTDKCWRRKVSHWLEEQRSSLLCISKIQGADSCINRNGTSDCSPLSLTRTISSYPKVNKYNSYKKEESLH